MDTYGAEFELSIDVKRLFRKVQPRSEVHYEGTIETGTGTGEVRPSCAAGALLEEGLITPPFASSKHVFLSGSCFVERRRQPELLVVCPRWKSWGAPNGAPKRR